MTASSAQRNGVVRCPNCGGSDVRFDEKIGKLKCLSCRSVIESELTNVPDDVSMLKGTIVGRGAEKILDDKSMVTLKCSSCGSEVSINTDEALSARCPWCRHTLSINEKIANGAVPDMILPFKITREQAFEEMLKYVSERKALSKKEFIEQFSKDNLMGVFLPYMVIDMNVHAEMSGIGEREVRRYTVGSGDDRETRYDVDQYNVSREFDLEVDDLTIEASSDKLNQNANINTNNIINAIMPFDTENAVEWDARYVSGYACEKRDVDIKDLDRMAKFQVEDIMRYQMIDTLSPFGRGVRWDKMRLEQKGVKWKTACMPVWLYSYLDKRDDGKSKLHYIAINGRTGEKIGSTPIESKRVVRIIFGIPAGFIVATILFSIMGLVLNNSFLETLSVSAFSIGMELSFMWMVFSGIIIAVMASKYRNKSARHMHEQETRAQIKNLKALDEKTNSIHGTSRSMLYDRNDIRLKGIQQKNGGIMMRRVIYRTKKKS